MRPRTYLLTYAVWLIVLFLWYQHTQDVGLRLAAEKSFSPFVIIRTPAPLLSYWQGQVLLGLFVAHAICMAVMALLLKETTHEPRPQRQARTEEDPRPPSRAEVDNGIRNTYSL